MHDLFAVNQTFHIVNCSTTYTIILKNCSLNIFLSQTKVRLSLSPFSREPNFGGNLPSRLQVCEYVAGILLVRLNIA